MRESTEAGFQRDGFLSRIVNSPSRSEHFLDTSRLMGLFVRISGQLLATSLEIFRRRRELSS